MLADPFFFYNPAYQFFIGLAKAELLALENRLSRFTPLIQQFKLNYDDRDPDMVRDQKRLKQVRATIVRLEAAAKEREKNKAPSKAQGKGKGPRASLPLHPILNCLLRMRLLKINLPTEKSLLRCLARIMNQTRLLW